MTLTDMLRYGGVLIQVIGPVNCLGADSKTPATDPGSKNSTTNLHPQTAMVLLESNRVMVSIETARRTSSTTQVLVIHDSPAPWKHGNFMGLRFPKTSVPGEDCENWRVANMHTENFFEAASQLKLSSVEVQLLGIKVQEFGHPDSTASYAVVTDARIPRNWYLSWPGRNFGGEPGPATKTERQLKAAYPENFRPDD